MTYERLLDSAIDVFEENGYRAATISQIAQRAGADRTTFYLHFKNKSDVATGIARRHISPTGRHFYALSSLQTGELKEVRGWVKTVFEYWGAFPMELEVLCDAIVSDPELGRGAAEHTSHLADIVLKNAGRALSAKERRIAHRKVELLITAQRTAMFSILCRDEGSSLNETVEALAQLWQECLDRIH